MMKQALKLFHVSEEQGVAIFKPRPVGAWDERVAGNAVWAIDEAHLPNYLLPRECPRVTYVRAATTTPKDAQKFFGISRAARIIALEPGWLERAMTTTIFVYELPARSFVCIDEHAGHYTSAEPVKPTGMKAVRNPLAAMLTHDVELRIVKDLLALHQNVARSSLSFSSTRLRNARRQPA